MNNLLKNLLFAVVAIATLSIVACTTDPGTTIEPIDSIVAIANKTGIAYDGTEDYKLVETTKNGECVVKLSGIITEDITIKPLTDCNWLFSGAVFVSGATLTIEKGTTIYFDAESAQTSFLSIAQGAKIMANGENGARILMTSSNELGTGTGADGGDWGGFVVNGNAVINVGAVADGEGGTGLYGGTNDADNSGSIKYLVLKHAGRIVGVDNELNGFSFNGVGSATVIEYVQSFNGEDDGFEFFGGMAAVKYAVSTGSKDDSFDWTHGWTGKGQYWLVMQMAGRGDRGFEADNLEADFTAEPYSNPIIANATIILTEGNSGATTGMRLRHGTKGRIHNAAVTGAMAYGVRGDDDATTGANVADGSLVVTNSTVFGIDAGATAWGKAGAIWENANGNLSTSVTLTDGVGTIAGGADANAVYSDSFFTADTNIGAVSASNNWLSGWAIKVDGSDY
jgi:hypothetical protein